MRHFFHRTAGPALRSLPRPVRLVLVTIAGVTLIALGFALIVLPGPFTIPLVLAGLAVLATEYAWARRLLRRAQDGASAVRKQASRRWGRRKKAAPETGT